MTAHTAAQLPPERAVVELLWRLQLGALRSFSLHRSGIDKRKAPNHAHEFQAPPFAQQACCQGYLYNSF
jgi:hypothetical protein